MKVLIIHCAYQYRGGEDTVVDEEMKLLSASGNDVELLHFTNEGNALFKMLQAPFNISAYIKTRKKIKAFAPDIVHIHNTHFSASPSVLYAVKHQGVPMICTLHNYRLLCPSAILFYNGKPFLQSLSQRFPWTAVMKGVYKNSRLITFWMAASMKVHQWLGTWRLPSRYIVLSKHAKKIFTESNKGFFEDQFVVKPNFFAAAPTERLERTNTFLFAGRLTEEKGIRLLLKAFAGSPYNLLIAGDGPLKEEVTQFCKSHTNILYNGAVSKAQLVQLMQQCTALIFPSVWYEGMPLTIIESFACGLPVIATRLGAMEYMVTPQYDGLLFEAGNLQELQQAITTWSSLTESEQDAYRHNAKQTYQQAYTPQKNAEALMSIYDAVRTGNGSLALTAVT